MAPIRVLSFSTTEINEYICRLLKIVRMNTKLVFWACFFGLTSVILGAFGAHILGNYLTFEELQSFKTATSYQLFHSLLLLLVASSNFFSTQTIQWAGRFLRVGIFLFSFSIYALTLDRLIGIDVGFLGPITPLGGLCLIVSWGILMTTTFTKLKKQ